MIENLFVRIVVSKDQDRTAAYFQKKRNCAQFSSTGVTVVTNSSLPRKGAATEMPIETPSINTTKKLVREVVIHGMMMSLKNILKTVG